MVTSTTAANASGPVALPVNGNCSVPVGMTTLVVGVDVEPAAVTVGVEVEVVDVEVDVDVDVDDETVDPSVTSDVVVEGSVVVDDDAGVVQSNGTHAVTPVPMFQVYATNPALPSTNELTSTRNVPGALP